ncbi:MAG: HDOD domain-containing protein [Planctomycetota bacterium]|jgi:putative nucleotidyltransferase with HDIG domain
MAERPVDTIAAYQVEDVIRQVDWLWPLPCVAGRFLSELNQLQLTPSSLAELLESDPALGANTFSILHQEGLRLGDEEFSIRGALGELPPRLIRDTFLSVKLYPAFGASSRGEFRKQLTLHSLAVACCARGIAEIISPEINSGLAYLAGLLHDIGKFALDQEMPKSFARIVEEAKSENYSICAVEQKHLGIDHTILGKRLAQKWRLPNEIILAVWLHHTSTGAISQSMGEAKIAQIVQLADCIARQCEIGQSGSYNLPVLRQMPGISPEQLQQIRRGLGDKVAQKSKAAGLDLPEPQAVYINGIQMTATQLAKDNTKLSSENYRLQLSSGYFDFITEFLLNINSRVLAIEAAENFAAGWQKFYQTGMVCLYFAVPGRSQVLEAVVVESPSQNKTVLLKAPADAAIPRALVNDFQIIDAAGQIDWLFEQLDVDFELSQTKLLPLLSGGKAIGAIVFELRHPVETERLREQFEAAASIGASVLDIAIAGQRQQHFAERFVCLVREPVSVEQQVETGSAAEVLAEMAAGAAHELNNPLSVISGRAQLLADAETEPEKKQILEQIRQNARELSGVIDCLMNFAEPAQPRPSETGIKQILDEAAELTTQKTSSERLDIQIAVADGVNDVFVDSAQIASAIANIFTNSIESYSDENGLIEVVASGGGAGEVLKLQITDHGCGMDAETVRKAVQPFFSAKPAGRKRGMGLASAQRIIQLNKGSVDITSHPGKGTTVTISLPCKRQVPEGG